MATIKPKFRNLQVPMVGWLGTSMRVWVPGPLSEAVLSMGTGGNLEESEAGRAVI